MYAPRFRTSFGKFNLADLSHQSLELNIYADGTRHQVIFDGEIDMLECFKDEIDATDLISELIELVDRALSSAAPKLFGWRNAKWEAFKAIAETRVSIWDYQRAIANYQRAKKEFQIAEDMIVDAEFNLPIWTDGERVDCLWIDLLTEWRKQPMIGPEPNLAHMIAA